LCECPQRLISKTFHGFVFLLVRLSSRSGNMGDRPEVRTYGNSMHEVRVMSSQSPKVRCQVILGPIKSLLFRKMFLEYIRNNYPRQICINDRKQEFPGQPSVVCPIPVKLFGSRTLPTPRQPIKLTPLQSLLSPGVISPATFPRVQKAGYALIGHGLKVKGAKSVRRPERPQDFCVFAFRFVLQRHAICASEKLGIKMEICSEHG